MPDNQLFYGDNLDVLRRHVESESIDLVYLDPPFNSQQDYNVLFAEQDGSRSAAQIQAFGDTWRWDQGAEAACLEMIEAGGKVSIAIQAFRQMLGSSDMMAYIAMMAPRLVELRRVLKSTGSIYLHCDPTASHYLKILMDAIFEPANFRNEIIWQRTNAHSDSKRWADIADTLLYYGKTRDVTWATPRAPYSEEYLKAKYGHDDGDGRGPYQLHDMTSPHPRPNMMYEWNGFKSPGPGWRFSKETMKKLHDEGRIWYPEDKSKRPRIKRYLKEMKGSVMGCVWTDLPPLNSQAQERLGYPTQKPQALLERIIKASSNEGDTILDPFCGCGTTIAAAQALRRPWIGIDVTSLAITLIKHRLRDSFGEDIKKAYTVLGEPTSLPDAQYLADRDPYQFQWWSLGLVGARPVEQKKGADKGIDGKLYFHEGEDASKTKQIVFSVKAGSTSVAHVRDLRGVLEREKAAIAVLITMHAITKPMRTEAAEAGFYESSWTRRKHPRLQILTVEELLQGKTIDSPPLRHTSVTFKKAPKARRGKTSHQPEMFDEPEVADDVAE